MSTATSTPSRRSWVSLSGSRPSTGSVIRTTILIIGAILTASPLVWAALASFKTPTELATVPPTILPVEPTLANYEQGLATFDFLQYASNSVIVTLASTALTLIINTMAAFALAKYNFRGRNVLFLITLAMIMIPLQVILLPVHQTIASLGMTNTLWGLIIPPAATPTGVFLLRQYMLTLPDETLEAARIDGATELGIFLRIVLPLSMPAIAVLAIFSIIWRWNDFLWPLLVAQSEDVQTLPVAIARFSSQEVVPLTQILAISVVSIVPVVIIFLVLQRQIISGLTTGAVK